MRVVVIFLFFISLEPGMGRAIETNLEAPMTVDCLNLGMIKHAEVPLRLAFSVF
jgi:hypothetical protein